MVEDRGFDVILMRKARRASFARIRLLLLKDKGIQTMTGTAADIPPDDLHHLALFRSVPYHEIKNIIRDFPLIRIDAGKIVIAAEQSNRRMYLVVEGRFSVHLDAPDSEAVAELGAGEMFGELSVIDGEPTSAFVVAKTNCQVVGLDRDALWDLYKRSPYVAHNLLNTLARRIRNSNDLIEHLQRELTEPDPGFDIEPEM